MIVLRMKPWLAGVLTGLAGTVFFLASGLSVRAEQIGQDSGPKTATPLPDPYSEVFRDYDPQFRFPERMEEKERKLSSEPLFFTLNLLEESSRATALVEAGKAKEAEGRFGEAAEIYQKVIDDYPDTLYRVNEFGVFVPVAEYCQLRLLEFPAAAIELYRTKHDARAMESFQYASQHNSLEGLAQIRDSLLATSYGAPALKTLGYSALDRGHYLEALEYFERVWDFFPESRTKNPDLALSMELCRRMLGHGPKSGLGYGLIGHWKLDEGSGARASDSSGCLNDGTVGNVPNWVGGKDGSCLRFDWSNGVAVAASKVMNIGVGGSDFSAAFWLMWESGSYPNNVFSKAGRSADEMLKLEIDRKNQVNFALATRSPRWETGSTSGALVSGRWTHVALVKKDRTVRLFLDGRLDSVHELKEPSIRNLGGVTFGQYFFGCMDDVRLYSRALLDREAAELAGATGAAGMKCAPESGRAPLTVDFAANVPADSNAGCFWEFGDGATATGKMARHVYGLGGDFGVVLTVTGPGGTVSVARATAKVEWTPENRDLAARMGDLLKKAHADESPLLSQRASAPDVGTGDYVQMPPTTDPLGVTPPVWQRTLPGSRRDVLVNTHPVVTDKSVVYRHKNIVYCHSILNGELRWVNDLGGRVNWQDWENSQFCQEDVLVQDGVVVAPVHKVGPTLTAFDEITGRLKWAYGPMVSLTPEESSLRFESGAAGSPMTVYAGYIQDNIQGETHTDTEYGLMAFDITTGRIKWRTKICTLRPGKFAAGFAVKRRSRVRSFASPPLYHQGTVYYCSNAGATVAVDALSGRIKWLMRYPYHDGIHDATAKFGRGHHSSYLDRPPSPMLWYGFPPLLVGDSLYVTPIDAPTLFSIERRTGRVKWSVPKPSGNVAYFLGPDRSGELVLVTDGRSKYHRPDGNTSGPPLHLLDPESGKTLWTLPDIIMTNDHVVTSSRQGEGFALEQHYFTKGARPFLTSDDRLIVPDFHHLGWPVFGYINHLAEIDLGARRIVSQRRYYSGEVLGYIDRVIREATPQLKELEALPHKDDQTKAQIAFLRDVERDTVPVNSEGPFFPFSRLTFERYGTPFEMRMSARSIEVTYDRPKVAAAVADRNDPEGLFARAELAMGDNRFAEAARLMVKCLDTISPEDQDFRAAVNQLLFKTHKELARAAIRSGDKQTELENVLGMSKTVTTLADEVETLFAAAECAERRGEFLSAALHLQNVARVYGQYEYPVPDILVLPQSSMETCLGALTAKTSSFASNPLFGTTLCWGISKTGGTLPLYYSAVSPLPKALTLRAGELSASVLIRMQRSSPEFAAEFDKRARAAIAGMPPEEQLARLWGFPGTPAAQAALDGLFAAAEKDISSVAAGLSEQALLRRRLWKLADAARICGLSIPEKTRSAVLAPPPDVAPGPIDPAQTSYKLDMEEARGTAWLALERNGGTGIRPELVFLGGRVRKLFDNKFLLYCVDTSDGKTLWKATEKRGETWFDEIRLRDKGDEPGFSEVFLHGDLAIVHGIYDVLAFGLDDGRARWRYEVPFSFEIKHAMKSGDMLFLAGQSETIALYLPTGDPRGEVAWQTRENGDLYIPPYFAGNRLVSVRKSPSNLSVRYRSTGNLVGRLALPDLVAEESDPVVEDGVPRLPSASDGDRLVLSDGTYYIMLDVRTMAVLWKRLIDSNDPACDPAMRFCLSGDYLAVMKKDYDVKAIHMLSSRTGEILWRTDARDPNTTRPLYSPFMVGERLYGLRPHAGQGFYFAGVDAGTGKDLFGMNEQTGYAGKPRAQVLPVLHGGDAVVLVKDRQDFEIKAFDAETGKLVNGLKSKGTGDFGEHGRVSAVAQGGRLVLLGRNDLLISGNRK
jgi:outer membrane protein assembly factor BamB/tetratricopeptide (TPR) repeat protein